MSRSADGSRLIAVLVSPRVAFPVLWLAAVLLAQVHVVSLQAPWSFTAWSVILMVPVAFLAGGWVATRAVNRPSDVRRTRGGVRSRRPSLVALMVVGYAELAREYLAAGGVPLLSHHIDATRVSIHPGVLGLLIDGLTVAAIVAIASPARVFSRAALPELAIAAVSLGGFALSGGRQALAIAAAGGIARVLYWRAPRLRTAAAYLLLGLAVFSLFFFLRTGQEPGQAFTNQLYGTVLPHTPLWLAPLIPLHLALAMNIVVLAKVTEYFPHVIPYGHGIYDAWALHSVLPARQLSGVTATFASPWIVSTAAGPLWADGGLPVVAGGCLLIGAVTSAPHALYRRTRRFSHAVLAGYFTSIALYCVYDNLLTQYKDWIFVGLGLMWIGRQSEAPEPEAPMDTADPTGKSVLAVGLAALVVLVLVAIFANDELPNAKDVASARLSPGVPGTRRIAPNAFERDLTASRSATLLLGESLATYAQPGRTGTLWAVTAHAGSILATPMQVRGRTLTALRPVTLPGPASSGQTQYAVAGYGASRGAALFEFSPTRHSLSVRVVSLAGPPTVLLDARASTPALPAGTRRSYGAAADATAAELLEVDQLPRGRRLIIRQYAVAGSGLGATVISVKFGGGFPARRWKAALGAIQTTGPDLALIGSPAAAGAAALEVHVLPRVASYLTPTAQTDLGLSVAQARPLRFVVGPASSGAFMLYAIAPRSRTVREIYYR